MVLISGLSAALFASPALGILSGLSIDVLTALRWLAFGERYDASSSPVVVVAIDEESYRTPPFEGAPSLTWTREIGRVLTAIVDGGAKVVGFDIVYPRSIEETAIPFEDEILGTRLRGFDRDFLRALAIAARSGKLVLGEVLHRDRPIRPSAGQRIAVGQQRNIRALNAYNDVDDVIRRLPLTLTVDGKPIPSMALELASRAINSAPATGADGSITIGSYRIPSAIPNTMTLNFEGGANDIPTYSFADLRACIEKGDADFFRRHFGGRVVLLGTLLDFEDRKITSKRFATGTEKARAPRCMLPMSAAGPEFRRSAIAGVYIHATGVNNLLRRDVVTELDWAGRLAIIFVFSALVSGIALIWAPTRVIFVYLSIAAAGIAVATWVFERSVAVPVAEPALAGLVAMSVTIGYRFMVSDRDKQFLRKSFALYLSPKVIERMLASNKLPVLGGEIRNVTIYFSDIAGFSSISEKLSPTELVALMNEYLSAMSDIIEDNGGFIDKYIGDAIVAVFGAPVEDRDHASSAVRAALQCRVRLEELNRTSPAFRGYKLAHRIGLNSGEALVGNIGSKKHFNYTVMSDAVNLASRLEGANKYYATSIMASEETVERAGKVFAWRELDAIRVKGRSHPVRIYDLLDETERVTSRQAAVAAAYAEGLAHWRNREFASAVECFERQAAEDPPSAMFLTRAKSFVLHPPASDWDPVSSLEGK